MNYDDLRQVGAVARAMLVNAAATAWNCPSGDCKTAEGHVIHVATGRKASYGSLAGQCAGRRRARPQDGPAEGPQGLQDHRQVDAAVRHQKIVTGQPLFGIDVRVPGMLYATYEKAPGVRRPRWPAPTSTPPARCKGVRKVFVVEGGTNLDRPAAAAWPWSPTAGGRRARAATR